MGTQSSKGPPKPANSYRLNDWGVDTDNNHVWAVLNHTGDYGVVPESGTLAMLLGGVAGLVMYGWRRRHSC